MLQNADFLAKIGPDTAENEQHFAEILPKTSNYPTGRARGGPVRPAHARETVPLAPPREPPGPTPTGAGGLL